MSVTIASVGFHDGRLRDAVHALKFRGHRSLARPLARLMHDAGTVVLARVDLAVPVPLHWHRRLSRGFNQAELLARELGVPTADVLVRRRNTPPQVGLQAGQRFENVRGAFSAGSTDWRGRLSPDWLVARGWLAPFAARASVAGATVVLVDDVVTTGATLAACASALISAGAREVRAITAARVSTAPLASPRPTRPPASARHRR
jgi:predicted amidophosphoribosyltransferase